MCSKLASCQECSGGQMDPPTLHCESQLPMRLQRACRDVNGPRLTVPHIFARFQFSVIYTQLGATQGTLMEQQRSMLQRILKHFTKELTSGFAVMSVMTHDGNLLEHACHLDQALTMLCMRPLVAEVSGGATSPSAPGLGTAGGAAAPISVAGADAGGGDANGCKAILFREIERICSPEELRNVRIDNILLIDECCTTVVLSGRRFVTLRLDTMIAREYLMLCLQVLRMSQDKTRMWYP